MLNEIKELIEILSRLNPRDKAAFRLDVLTVKKDMENSEVQLDKGLLMAIPCGVFDLLQVNRFLTPNEITNVRSVLLSLERFQAVHGHNLDTRVKLAVWTLSFRALLEPMYQAMATTVWGFIYYNPQVVAELAQFHPADKFPHDNPTFTVKYPSILPVVARASSIEAHDKEGKA